MSSWTSDGKHAFKRLISIFYTTALAQGELIADDNVLGNLIVGIILQIKPYRPRAASNGKEERSGAKTGKSMKIEIDERAQAKIGAGMNRYDALVEATAEAHKERIGKILEVFEASQKKKEEPLPRKGAFRWLRRNGNGGDAARQPQAIKK